MPEADAVPWAGADVTATLSAAPPVRASVIALFAEFASTVADALPATGACSASMVVSE
ncbi:hypothetical protein D9M68_502760 [compost metagenome]